MLIIEPDTCLMICTYGEQYFKISATYEPKKATWFWKIGATYRKCYKISYETSVCQCCGSGPRIRCFFTPGSGSGIQDGKKPGSGSNIRDRYPGLRYISVSLLQTVCIFDSVLRIRIRDKPSGSASTGYCSGINFKLGWKLTCVRREQPGRSQRGRAGRSASGSAPDNINLIYN